MGPGPELKSVEFCLLPSVVDELCRKFALKPLKKVLHFMGSGPSSVESTPRVVALRALAVHASDALRMPTSLTEVLGGFSQERDARA